MFSKNVVRALGQALTLLVRQIFGGDRRSNLRSKSPAKTRVRHLHVRNHSHHRDRTCNIVMEATQRCVRTCGSLNKVFGITRTREVTLPAFLVPAFTRPAQSSQFSTSPRCRSKIGALPLTLPPDVTFTIIPASTTTTRGRVGSSDTWTRVEVDGPLGKIGMPVAPFISIAQDDEARTRTLSIQDDNDKKQRGMWGEYPLVQSGG
jgi:large subunit ribosomal protein L6